MKAENLVTFFDLLSDGYTVAQLATAVEQHGVTGWDRYGRYGTFKPSDDATKSALDALADCLRAEDRFWDEKSQEQRPDRSEINLEERFIDTLEDWFSLRIHRFGWPKGQVPAIDRTSEPLPPRSKGRLIGENTNTLLNILGCVMLCMQEKHKAKIPMRLPSEAGLIIKLCNDYGDVTGISKPSLENYFADAKRSAIGSMEVLKKTP